MFLVAAVWYSSEAALTLSGLPCIFIVFLLLMCDNLSWRTQPYGESCLLGRLEHRRSSGTIPTDVLSRAPEYLFQRDRERYLHHIRVVYG